MVVEVEGMNVHLLCRRGVLHSRSFQVFNYFNFNKVCTLHVQCSNNELKSIVHIDTRYLVYQYQYMCTW